MKAHDLVLCLSSLGFTLLFGQAAIAQTAPPPSDATSVLCADLVEDCELTCGSADPDCLAGCASLCSAGTVDCTAAYDATNDACVVSAYSGGSALGGTIAGDTDYCGCHALCGQTPSPCVTGPVTGPDDFTALSCTDQCYADCEDSECYELCDKRCSETSGQDYCSASFFGGSCWLTTCGGVGEQYECETYELAHPTGGVFDYCGCHKQCGPTAPCN